MTNEWIHTLFPKALLGWNDFVILGVVVSLMVCLGYLLSQKGQTTEDFFLARRQIPWWAAMLSFVATEVSAVTIISVPATAYRENWMYAQFFIGSFLARLVLARVFIPAFYEFECTTIYEYLRHRFGPATQYCATVFFFITRLLGSGVRLTAAALALSILLGWPIPVTVFAVIAIGVLYISYGGVRAVVWTGVFQAAIFIVGGLSVIYFIVSHIPGGWHETMKIAYENGKLHLINWGPDWKDPQFFKTFFSDPNIIWIAILNGFFGSMAAFGTDHELMQRLLTVETRAKSQRTTILSSFASFFVLSIYLVIGTCLFVFFFTNPQATLPEKLEGIFPHFIGHQMPHTLRGLVVAAIVLASIDSPLMSLTSSFVTDIYKPLIRSDATESEYMSLSRKLIFGFGLLLGLIALAFSQLQNLLWLAFKIGGITFGSMLGVFLLGLLTKRKANASNMVGMIGMAVINLGLLIASEQKWIPLGWTWLVILGTLGTFGCGYLLSQPETPKKQIHLA